MQSDHEELRARVFISCGQSKQTDEVTTARDIANRLRELGFDPYVAVQEQSLRGLKENIFEQLGKSEYFIFVDFKRERLVCPDRSDYRGSLFSHQELAVASYLEKPVLAFQEAGVKSDDGIIRFLQASATPFTDRHLLPDVIAAQIVKCQWNPRWRSELVLMRSPGQYSDAQRVGPGGQPLPLEQRMGRFFHIGVRNRHHHATARNCYVYLERATRLDPPTEIPITAAEFKWAGYVQPNANIPANTDRRFDAFYVLHGIPTVLQFNLFADSSEFVPRINGEGRFELSYLVVSDNFPPARETFILDLRREVEETTLIAKPS